MSFISWPRNQKQIDTINRFANLKESLELIGDVPDDESIWDYAIEFFNIVTPEFYFCETKDKDIESIKWHILHICQNPDIRTVNKYGTPVTKSNLFVTDKCNMFYSIRQLLDFKGECTRRYIRGKLSDFIKSHRTPMMTLLAKVYDQKIKAETKKAAIFEMPFIKSSFIRIVHAQASMFHIR